MESWNNFNEMVELTEQTNEIVEQFNEIMELLTDEITRDEV